MVSKKSISKKSKCSKSKPPRKTRKRSKTSDPSVVKKSSNLQLHAMALAVCSSIRKKFKRVKVPSNFIIANKFATAKFTQDPKAIIRSLYEEKGQGSEKPAMYRFVQLYAFLFMLLFRHL